MQTRPLDHSGIVPYVRPLYRFFFYLQSFFLATNTTNHTIDHITYTIQQRQTPMYNFYQSQLRVDLNKNIYQKPTIDVEIFWHIYQWILWEKKIGPLQLTWIQILWVQWLTEEQQWQLPTILTSLAKNHNAFSIQIWFTDIIHGACCRDLDKPTTIQHFQEKHATSNTQVLTMWYTKSHKENLPPSTYFIDLAQPLEKIRTAISSQHKNKIKKAQKHDVICSIATQEEAWQFHTLLQKTGNNKWFGVIWPKTFVALIEEIYTHNTWKIYLCKVAWEIVWWALYLLDHKANTAIYLYGATDRAVWNIGIWQYIHWYIFEDLKQAWFTTIDLLGWWPTWNKQHHLSAVWAFKEWFGGKKIEYAWSYDIVYNRIVYTLWSLWYRYKKH